MILNVALKIVWTELTCMHACIKTYQNVEIETRMSIKVSMSGKQIC